ncbi:hypothetical protein LJC63_09735 [Ruminococcaceae bacterium OttesenSCG-928-L11]|nr:hypothetical protein [Ruminococcaceae bacterium OttesenSCG-928-L11]
MSRLPEKILFGLVSLVIAAWIGFHIFDYYYNPIELEAVYDYTISDTLPARGIAIRDETVIEQAASGIENYLYEDGARVTVSSAVAEFYGSAGSDRNVKRMREIEEEIAMLTVAQDKVANNYANTDTINRNIRDQLGQLAEMSSIGDYALSQQVRASLVSLLNRRQVATGKVEDFEERISTLQAEYDRLQRTTVSSDIAVANAPVSGYFVKTVDGYERYLSSRTLKEYGIDDYVQIIRRAIAPPASRYAGKMVTSHEWYFAVAVQKHYTESMYTGQGVQLEFPSIGQTIPSTLVRLETDLSKDNAVLVFYCDQINADLVNLRVEDVEIHFVQHRGLRLNPSSIYFNKDGERGVYILEDDVVRFKKVKVIYEGTGFLLSELNVISDASYDKEYVRLYNQVIVKGGVDLYDGKTIA